MINELITSREFITIQMLFIICFGIWIVFVHARKIERLIANGEKTFIPKDNLPWLRRLGWALVILGGGSLVLSFFV